MRILIALIVSLVPASAWADAYKCVSEDGAVTYADQPCGPDAQVFEYSRDLGNPLAGFRRLDAARDKLREIRIYNNRQDVEREIRRSRARIAHYEQTRSERLAQLRAERDRLGDDQVLRYDTLSPEIAISSGLSNVADATRDVALAEEMQAVNQRYSSLVAQERAEIDLRFKERLILYDY